MNLYTLYDKSGIHSGRALGAQLMAKLSGKGNIQRGRPGRLDLLLRRQRFDYVVNVGWFKPFNCGNATILNTPEAIAQSSNKRGARVTFRDNDIPAPKLWLSPRDIAANDFPVIARTTHHTKGRGLWFCKTRKEAIRAGTAGATHYLKFIPNSREFRVHVMAPSVDLEPLAWEDYKVIKLSEKIPNADAEPDPIVKSHDNGWVFSYPSNKKNPSLPLVRDTARQAIAQFGLHWGAVDIMVSKDTGSIYVLEINSTPCLTDDTANTLQKYTDSISALVGTAPSTPRKKKTVAEPIKQRRAKLRQSTVLYNTLGKYI